MRPVVPVLLALLSLVVAALAVYTSPSEALSTGAAVLAALLAAGALLTVTYPSGRVPLPGARPATSEFLPVREWVRSGHLGREEVVRLLDRMGSHPSLGVRTVSEMDAIQRMPRSAFLDLVRRRLDEIEGPP